MHLRTAATSSAMRTGLVRKVVPLSDGARLSVGYPDKTTNGLPDAWSFCAIGSDVSLPRLTLRTATSHPGSAISWSAFATDVAGPRTSKPALAWISTERNWPNTGRLASATGPSGGIGRSTTGLRRVYRRDPRRGRSGDVRACGIAP